MDHLRIADIEEIPRELLRTPLDWFFAEHYRHRQFCRLLTEVAAAHVFDEERVAGALRFLREDLAVHVIDEEQDLFPLLRRRAQAEDSVEDMLGALSLEHRADATQAQALRGLLEACLADRRAPGMDPAAAQKLIEEAHQVCPYSNATRGNITVQLKLV